MPKVLKIEKDMDAATMADMRAVFDELTEARENVEIDMTKVEFIDSSGIGGLIFLYKRLLSSGVALSLKNVGGQPLRLLTHLRMQTLISSRQEGWAA